MAKFDISKLIVSPILRDAKGRAVFNPVTAVGQRLMIVPPDGKVLVVVATHVDVRCSPGDFPRVTITGNIEEFTTVDGVLLEATELTYAPQPDTAIKRKIQPL